jgi:hypothetical protein
MNNVQSGRDRPSSTASDPVFALIADYKTRYKKYCRAYDALHEAESQARKTHGDRPSSLIEWRKYSAIGGTEIDKARDAFLRLPDADQDQIEREYRHAKARRKLAEQAGVEWDHRADIVQQRLRVEAAWQVSDEAKNRLARSKPTTITGAAALLDFVRKEIEDDICDDWLRAALTTTASCLAKMNAVA